MHTGRGAKIIAWLIFPVLALAVWGCGIKSPPIPGRMALPHRVSEPVYEFNEDGDLVVMFRPPDKNVNGQPLKDLSGFYVERSDNLVEPDFCPDCPVTFSKRIEIEAKTPPERLNVADVTYRFVDRLRPGYVYHYRIFAHDRRGNYDPDLFQSLVVFFDSPVAPPACVNLTSEDGVVFLDWTPSDRLMDGRPVASLEGYVLYRRIGGKDWVVMNPDAPVQRTSFQDVSAQRRQDIDYKIRSVRRWRGTTIVGPPTPVQSVHPVDLTPPPPPAKVYAVSFEGGIKLTWPEVGTSDLAGYRVYRRIAGQTRFERLGPELVTDILFLDQGARPGRVYEYQVTSVDDSAAANESEPSRPVRVPHYDQKKKATNNES